MPIKFKPGFRPGKIRPKPNSHNVSRNRSIVAKVIPSLVAVGHVSTVTEKPAALNIVAKADGSPRLIHNLRSISHGVLRGLKVSQPNLFGLSRSWTSSTYFCKINLRHVY